ncbi:SanA/YdcF family protein [Tsukamurella paurometabola]|uniref:Vancomycin high temperature exclusion protein n=2 Tax=Tsukamurella paurometabola TaxID=2061 RepID=A0A3P8KCI1_TSUPA|nr:ElyC/SanA/YdcF family protein [Tsukamurella paurometabola]UEA84728.1 YdcF family protein [Tsukamurella paurometabola]VDR37308.1 vancomycin high temperature exclusion protein [Tsukamurella paurometabola]
MFAIVRRLIRYVVIAAVVVMIVSSAWVQWESRSRIATDASRPWVVVLGDRVHDGEPSVYLRERLDTALTILRGNRAQRVLISGHAASTKGDEVAAMRKYLTERGIAAEAITDDRFGVTTYNTCARAASVFGITGAILVTQDFHLRRAVALCRTQGIDAVGAEADSDAGVYLTVRNWVREIALSRPKAALDALRDADPVSRER